jgi:hypothetical protein
VVGGFRYYGGPTGKSEYQPAAKVALARISNARPVTVSPGRLTEGVDFQFAPFKKGTWRSYTSLDGLAANFVICMEKAHDGALWFGTGGGVSRFDGVRFATFKQEDGLSENQVCDILAQADGTMWFASASGLSRGRKAGSALTFDKLSFPPGWVMDGNGWRPELAPSDGKDLWVAGGNALWRLDGKQFHQVAQIPGLWNKSVGEDGSVWLGSTNLWVWRVQGTNLTRVDLGGDVKRCAQPRRYRGWSLGHGTF